MKDENHVHLLGVVGCEPILQGEYEDEKIYVFNLKVHSDGRTDVIPVRVSDRFLAFRDLKVGAVVELMGNVRTVVNTLSPTAKVQIASVFVTSIKILQVENGAEIPYANEVTVEGTLCNTVWYKGVTADSRQVCNRMLRVKRSHNKESVIQVQFRGRHAEYVSVLAQGVHLACMGVLRMRNYSKSVDGKEVPIHTLEITVRHYKER